MGFYKRFKVSKSKQLLRANFGMMKKCQYFAEKNCNIFWHFWAKTWRAGQKLETFHVETLYPALKKPGKQKNLRAALHCEFLIWNTQIFSKYFHNFDQQKYLDSFFKEMFNWFPQFYLHPVCCMFELKLILWQFLLLQQLVPNIKRNWNWEGEAIQTFSSEIILTWENGSQA